MKEVSEYLHISRDTVINWINKEGMSAHKKGRLRRFDVNEVDKRYEKYDRDPAVRRRYGRAWKRIRDSYATAHP